MWLDHKIFKIAYASDHQLSWDEYIAENIGTRQLKRNFQSP